MPDKTKTIAKKPVPKRFKAVQTKKSGHDSAIDTPIGHIMSLHQTIGNQAVRRLFESGTIQASLKIGHPNDKYEQEADRVADKVMRMPEPKVQLQTEEEEEEELIQPKPISDKITPLVQRQVVPEAEEKEILQTKEGADYTPPIAQDLESRIQELQGSGKPLPRPVRKFFEPRFDHNFSRVRIHHDSEANRLAAAINAQAFTVGHNIVFGAGRYAPRTQAGKRLMAHELTHVMQQLGGGRVSNLLRTNRIMRKPGFLRSLIGWVKKAVKAVVGFVVDVIKKMSPWTRKWVLFLLCDTSLGKATVGLLQKRSVYRFKSHSLKRQYYMDPSMTIKKGGVKILRALGYFLPKTGGIWIKEGLTNGHAASTFVHETTHAKQWSSYVAKKRKFDLAKWEYEAHIREEKYKIIKDISPKHHSFRKKKMVKGEWIWVVNKHGIIKWVNKKYGIKQYFRDWGEKVVGKTGPIGPWKCS